MVSKTRIAFCIMIIVILLGCKISNKIAQPGRLGLFSILIQYTAEGADINVLSVLNERAILQNYNILHKNIFSSEMEVSCYKLINTNIDLLREQLKQIAGVTNVIINPRY